MEKKNDKQTGEIRNNKGRFAKGNAPWMTGKKNNSPNNLIALCQTCHSQTNFNRDDWKNYFTNMLNNSRGVNII